VDELLEATERYYAGERSRTLPRRPPRLAYWEPSDGEVQRHNDYVHYESDAIAKILRKPLIGATAALLAQTHEIRIFQATLILKPPSPDEPTNIVPWHFDKHYWATCSSSNMLTAFIPFHDCTEEMGTITMIDGSHRWKEVGADDSVTRHFADRDKEDLEELLARNADFNNSEVRKIPMNIPKGHMSFHHCRMYHGSGGNYAAFSRRSVALHMQDGDNEYVPYTLTDGTQVAYNHDVLVRRTSDGRPDYSDPDFCPVLWRQ
jgi:ectoine hydroxylase-related dioxygenase (phytanoyl-CoA dioxygenase family)